MGCACKCTLLAFLWTGGGGVNYTKISNEYIEWLISLNLESLDFKVLLFVYRKTIGWHKLKDKISTSKFCEATKSSKRGVIKSISRLVNAGYLVSTNHPRSINEFTLVNPSYPVTKNLVNCVTQSGELGGKKLVNAGSPTIYNTKETIQKEMLETIEKEKQRMLSLKKI